MKNFILECHYKSKSDISSTIEIQAICLNEKLKILDKRDRTLLTKQSEVISYCRHQNKF